MLTISNIATQADEDAAARCALESRTAWAKHMQAKSNALETKLWENKSEGMYICNICNTNMDTAEAHLCGQKHYKKLWSLTHNVDGLPQHASLMQVFDTACGELEFNHLTGQSRMLTPPGPPGPPGQGQPKHPKQPNHSKDKSGAKTTSKWQVKQPIGEAPPKPQKLEEGLDMGSIPGLRTVSKTQADASIKTLDSVSNTHQADAALFHESPRVSLNGIKFSSKDCLVKYIFEMQDRYQKTSQCDVDPQDGFFLYHLAMKGKDFHSPVKNFQYGCLKGSEDQRCCFIMRFADDTESEVDWRTGVQAVFPIGPLVLRPCFEQAVVPAVDSEGVPLFESVPLFDQSANGGPLVWNENSEEVYWGRKGRKFLSDCLPGEVEISRILRFLNVRMDADDRPVLQKLGRPVPHDNDWYRLQWLEMSMEEWQKLIAEGWRRAWHGCKFEGLYSILYHNRFIESRSDARGERLLRNMPGVYVHQDKTFGKAEGYARFVNLFGNNVFYAAKFEVLVNRELGVTKTVATDQWCQPACSVRIVALWICGRTAAAMHDGDAFSPGVWDPSREGNPLDPRFATLMEDNVAVEVGNVSPSLALGDHVLSREVLLRCRLRMESNGALDNLLGSDGTVPDKTIRARLRRFVTRKRACLLAGLMRGRFRRTRCPSRSGRRFLPYSRRLWIVRIFGHRQREKMKKAERPIQCFRKRKHLANFCNFCKRRMGE